MRRGGTVTGAVSLVMIFIVLCLTVFAVLTLSTAIGEQKLAQVTADHVQAYYEADAQATAVIASLGGPDRPETVAGVALTYTACADNGVHARFTVPVGETQTLAVEVLIGAASCDILKWQTVYSGDWVADTSISVWDGQE